MGEILILESERFYKDAGYKGYYKLVRRNILYFILNIIYIII